MKRFTLLSTLLLALVMTGCAVTQEAKINQKDLQCGLLGPDCAGKLTPGAKGEADLRYINPDAQWTTYSKIMIDPVTFWGVDTTKVSQADQQMLVNYFQEQLNEQLAKKFTIVKEAGPGVMKLQVAMTDASGATPFLRSVSMIIPQAHMLSNLKYLATDTFPFVGGAQAEMKLTDSVSGMVLMEAMDKRIGGGAFQTGFQWQWGDAENVIKHWCEVVTTKLSALTAGEPKPKQ